MAAWPSPMSITPAFSPGPQITCGPVVGSLPRWMRLDLYEQCSDHITEKMPSSTRLGARPSAWSTRSYSSVDRPCSATISGVISVMRRGDSECAAQLQKKRRLQNKRAGGSLRRPSIVDIVRSDVAGLRALRAGEGDRLAGGGAGDGVAAAFVRLAGLGRGQRGRGAVLHGAQIARHIVVEEVDVDD